MPGEVVEYRVGSDQLSWSSWHNFRGPRVGRKEKLQATIIADVGESYQDGSQYHWMEPHAIDVMKGVYTSWATKTPFGDKRGSLLSTIRDAETDTDLVLHIGDLAYATGYETEWNYFMSQISPIAATAPYMTAQGNHERDYENSGSMIGGNDSGGECGVPTQARFQVPTPSGNQDKGWYSFNLGPAHFLIMDTEMSAAAGTDQFKFFESDLKSVDRSETPWIFFAGHRPMYSSADKFTMDLNNGPWWPTVESLLHKYNVDACLWGHVHNAEVTHPMLNSTVHDDGITHIVLGNGGQSLSQFNYDTPPSWSRWRYAGWGYTTLAADERTATFSFYDDNAYKQKNRSAMFVLEMKK